MYKKNIGKMKLNLIIIQKFIMLRMEQNILNHHHYVAVGLKKK